MFHYRGSLLLKHGESVYGKLPEDRGTFKTPSQALPTRGCGTGGPASGAIAIGLVDSYTMEKRYIRRTDPLWVQLVTARLDLNNHSDYSHICIVQDITKQKAFEAELYESERSKSVLLKNLGMAYRCLFVPNTQ